MIRALLHYEQAMLPLKTASYYTPVLCAMRLLCPSPKGALSDIVSSFACVADMPHRRRLRSASTEQLDVSTCRRLTIGGRAFPVAGAKVWNGLPRYVTSASSLSLSRTV